MGTVESDRETQDRLGAFREALARLGWTEGRNLHLDFRYGAGDISRIRLAAADLLGLAPTVLVISTTPGTRELQQLTKTIPIVFASIGDPVASGIVANIARPEANATGFSNFEPSLGGKWLGLLKEATPHVTRVALLFHPDLYSGNAFASIEATAPMLGLQALKTPIRDAVDIVRALDAFAAVPNGAVLVLPDSATVSFHDSIIRVAAQLRLPAIYPSKFHTAEGGLMSYAYDSIDPWRGAAGYVDRILRGAKGERPARAVPDQVRADHQPQNRQGDRPHHPRNLPAARGRSDRIGGGAYETARVHHPPRRHGGGVAGGCEGAAA
jgi:putative ABC transport system substrate-binding protein